MIVLDAPGGGPLPEGFLELPARVYAGDKAWIPEDPAEVARAFGPDSPWLRRMSAHAFVVPGRARVAVFFDTLAPAAYFGYFESTGDATAIGAVLGAAVAWARARGASQLYGPIQFSTAMGYRVLLGAEPGGLPFLGEPYNPRRYRTELELAGFAIAQRYLTQVVTADQAMLTRDRRRRVHDRLLARGYRIESLTADLWRASLTALHAVANQIFAANFGFVPLSEDEFRGGFGEPFARRLGSGSVIAYSPRGDIAGLCLVQPHYGPLLAAGVPVAELDASLHERQADGWVLKTIGVTPGYRSKGVADALSVAMLDRGAGRFTTLYGALIRADNASRNLAEATTAERWYALYSKSL